MAVDPQVDAPFRGVVKKIYGLGPARRIEIALESGGSSVEIDDPRMPSLALGQQIGLTPDRYRVFAVEN